MWRFIDGVWWYLRKSPVGAVARQRYRPDGRPLAATAPVVAGRQAERRPVAAAALIRRQNGGRRQCDAGPRRDAFQRQRCVTRRMA